MVSYSRFSGLLRLKRETDSIVGELEDCMGQLGDIEGEWQKTAEEVIKRIQYLIDGNMPDQRAKDAERQKQRRHSTGESVKYNETISYYPKPKAGEGVIPLGIMFKKFIDWVKRVEGNKE